MTTQDMGAILQRSCDLILSDPTLRPEYDLSGKLLVTHCNQGVRLVAQAMGCHDLDDMGLTADVMLSIMRGKWKKEPDGATATIDALSGRLVVAGLSSHELGESHGHVCCVYPVGMQHSNALGRDIPMVANVGPGDPAAPLSDIPGRPGLRSRNNWLCTVAWAFPCKRLSREPDYFVWNKEA